MSIEESHSKRFQEALKSLWVESGNAISHLYAGTGALESGSKITDAQRSISRTIKNNTSDSKSSIIYRMTYERFIDYKSFIRFLSINLVRRFDLTLRFFNHKTGVFWSKNTVFRPF